ncbi:hypothetical protein IEQ34_019491 [Dendrobium chrysotoxum]|uniref:Uncharacterized protein n=1 Tax=Dendrobium chrysotoxum TaxID=161865 RepID=A0AAV7G9K8_DENCH|nr:hypothetical protein IEQ34_019491 [Dendrobium chrysotoxum]
MNQIHIELVDAQTTINQHVKDQQILKENITILEDENKIFKILVTKKEITLSKIIIIISKNHRRFQKIFSPQEYNSRSWLGSSRSICHRCEGFGATVY